jgi:hypothetical protein
MSGSNGTIFRPSGGSSSSDAIAETTSDSIIVPSNNDGFTSTAATNPLNFNIGNSKTVRGQTRSLTIQTMMNDPNYNRKLSYSTDIQGSPVYKIIPSEPFQDGYLYAFGAVQLVDGNAAVNTLSSGSYEEVNAVIKNLTSSYQRIRLLPGSTAIRTGCIGICTKAKRVGIIATVNATSVDMTLTSAVDGVDQTTYTLDANAYPQTGAATKVGSSPGYLFISSTSDATEGMHDFRFYLSKTVGGSTSNVDISAIIIFENEDQSYVYPGVAIVDGNIYSSSAGTTLPIASPNFYGAASVAQQTGGGITLSVASPTFLQSIGIGFSGNNTIASGAGSGASFVQTGVYVADATPYFGYVVSNSIDTLTVGPTLTASVSGSLDQLWKSGVNASINYDNYNLIGRHTFSQYQSLAITNPIDNGFYWGKALTLAPNGVDLRVGASAFLVIEGYFNAVELEAARLSGISGLPLLYEIDNVSGISQTFYYNQQGYAAVPILENAHYSWHRIKIFANGTSVDFRSIKTYQFANNATLGAYHRQNVNATFLSNPLSVMSPAIGTHQRIYADNFRLQYMNVTTAQNGETFPSGVCLVGYTNSTASYSYYGRRIAVLGYAGSTTTLASLNGSSIGFSFNSYLDSGSEGINKLDITLQGPGNTAPIICGVDVQRTKSEWEQIMPFSSFTATPLAIKIPNPDLIPYVSGATKSAFGVTGAEYSVTSNICNVMRTRDWCWVDGLVQITGVSTVNGAFTIPGIAVSTSFMLATSIPGASQALVVGTVYSVHAGGSGNILNGRAAPVFVSTAAPGLFQFGTNSGSQIIQATPWSTIMVNNSFAAIQLSFPAADVGLGASITQVQIVPIS